MACTTSLHIAVWDQIMLNAPIRVSKEALIRVSKVHIYKLLSTGLKEIKDLLTLLRIHKKIDEKYKFSPCIRIAPLSGNFWTRKLKTDAFEKEKTW